MIVGKVNQNLEAITRITILDSNLKEHNVNAVLDTGFDGTITLPLSLINELNLERKGSGQAFLADGGEIIFDFFEAVILWNGQQKRIFVDAAETAPLVGMSLLEGFNISIDVCNKGKVEIELL
ncbi:MAG: hypothetical protein OMM_10667 [Candidatus Magnetoglobus multicellularis str. Araruama]|uniref:Clan AA aspartic protease n=1 Tax=Candidatus Magnetoglobus multicellularis str. Araruama TaxID=890399 RepID=A0A1V1P0F2_9BACT|nr:MAG: hypothetical protein OMM_10667 [Candidatus Magnetoglobus multicellularis str. Araruama]